MGQTLASGAQWSSGDDGTEKGRLDNTITNDVIVSRIIELVEQFPSKYPEESQYIFSEPFTWKTELDQTKFSEGYKISNGLLESEEVDQAGQPVLSLRLVDGGDKELSVSSFKQLRAVLQMGADKKKKETRLCLEANNDPIARILGDRFASISGSDDSIYSYIEEIISTPPTSDEGQAERRSKIAVLRLLLLLRDFDYKLRRESVKDTAKSEKLSPDDVNKTVENLTRLCGQEAETSLLKQIEWTESYRTEYKNGCRAPFERQDSGDIAYITVHTHGVSHRVAESGLLYITASTSGYFINKGLDRETRKLRFEPRSSHYRDLVILLRDSDAHFALLLDQSDFYKQRRHSQGSSSSSDSQSVTNQPKPKKGGGANRKKEESNKSRRDSPDGKTGAGRKKVEKEHRLEYSSTWKILELDERKDEKEKVDKEKDKQIKLETREKTKTDMEKDKQVELKIQKKTRTHRRKSDIVKEEQKGELFEISSSESEEDEEVLERYPETAADLPSEYWQIQKLIRFLKGGNQAATIIALCSLRDFDLEQETCQLAIRDVGGLEILINLLETDRPKCKVGALQILREISKNANIRRAIADLGAIKTMVKILEEQDKELKCLAAETIANVAKFRRARRAVRQNGGIENIVSLLSHPSPEVARSGAMALWSCCSESERNKEAMRQAGAIPLLAKLLKANNSSILIPVVGTVQECADDPNYRKAVRTEGMILDLVRNLRSSNPELQTLSANAIFKCAVDGQTRDLIRQYNGLDPLIDLVNKADNNRSLLAAVTGAIWKCAISRENVLRFQKMGAVDTLVNLLSNQPEEVLVNVAGALAELLKEAENRVTVRKSNGLPQLVHLLTGTNKSLLVNVTKAVGLCAEDPDNMLIIDRLDGVRLLWSLLKNQNQDVQSHAAWAICPCIENTKDAGEMVRSFVGGLELIVGLLGSDSDEVLAAVCAALSCIANDEENLAVITDHGVVPRLAALTPTTDEKLRQYLAEAIARCCNWSNNRVTFGTEGAVPHLVRYLGSPRTEVHRCTARALHQLSKHPDNCISMHENGVVKPLLELIGSDDHVLQEASAGCLSNIRRLSMANVRAKRLKDAEARERRGKSSPGTELISSA